MIKLERYGITESKKSHSIYAGHLWSIPVRVLERKKGTVAYRVLQFIKSFGEEGVKFTDIKRFLMEQVYGVKYNPVEHRGTYNTGFYGFRGNRRGRGLFYYYCEKVPGTEKWRLNPETMAYFATSSEEVMKYYKHPDERVQDIAKNNPNFPEDISNWAINLDDWT